MTLADRLAFDPALPWALLMTLAFAAALSFGFYLWRGGRAPILRAAGLILVLIGLAQPLLVRETREPTNDVAALIIDQSESLGLASRLDAARLAGAALAKRLGQEKGLELRVREVRGGPDGTAMMAALDEALTDVPRDRVAGASLVTDGQVSDVPKDLDRLKQFGPVQALIVGDPRRGDRRLELLSTPAFGIVGEPVSVEARIDDPKPDADAVVRISIDGQPVAQTHELTGRPFKININTPKRGTNMVIVEVDPGPQEITKANNRAAFELQGVRDRLRVLLITGEPHPGARVWRNLLKSDPSVDLVHFTILRPPEKQDFTPLDELALIKFPTRELFVDNIDQFDLIIFDRYQRRGILPLAYFENITRHIEEGGAMLVAAGPTDAGPDSLSHTPVAAILPSQPTGAVTNEPYRPAVTALGQRHPVTRDLPGQDTWGRWNRVIDAQASGGQVLMTGAGGRPLLVIDRAGKGRVAQLWSDQSWLWARGYDGGGPHAELLRRLAHWLMQEPELEDERLTLKSGPDGLTAERTTLGAGPGNVDVIAPSGAHEQHPFAAAGPGIWRVAMAPHEAGLYEAHADGLKAFAAVGPLNPKEAAALNATGDILKPLAESSGGGVTYLGESGAPLPQIRRVDRGTGASGAGWIGIRKNGAYVVRAAAAEPFGPGWAWAFAGLALLMLGWRREAG